MIDLHSHILPGMDDGAKDIETSLALLDQCRQQGISRIALTSHFDCENEKADAFLKRRGEAFDLLLDHLEERKTEYRFKLGAEVFFSTGLLKTDIKSLCLEGTNILLMELPVGYRPQFMRELLFELQSEGIIPLIAHIERYPYVMENPTILTTWLDAGAYAHVNAGTLLRKDKRTKMVFKLIQWGLVHAVASDTHSPDKRPQRLEMAYGELKKQLGDTVVEQMKKNAEALFIGSDPAFVDYYCPRKFLGRWI